MYNEVNNIIILFYKIDILHVKRIKKWYYKTLNISVVFIFIYK